MNIITKLFAFVNPKNHSGAKSPVDLLHSPLPLTPPNEYINILLPESIEGKLECVNILLGTDGSTVRNVKEYRKEGPLLMNNNKALFSDIDSPASPRDKDEDTDADVSKWEMTALLKNQSTSIRSRTHPICQLKPAIYPYRNVVSIRKIASLPSPDSCSQVNTSQASQQANSNSNVKWYRDEFSSELTQWSTSRGSKRRRRIKKYRAVKPEMVF